MAQPRWREMVDRGRVLGEEARCREVLDLRWLTSAVAWLAEPAADWEALFGGCPETRSYLPVAVSPALECWVIAWPRDGRLQLHDHGGASGVLRVVDGALRETAGVAGPVGPDGCRLLERPLRTRQVTAGGVAAFGPRHVHDVVNTDTGLATSVHLYSAAAAPMGFWAVDGTQLRPQGKASDAATVVDGPGSAAPLGSTR